MNATTSWDAYVALRRAATAASARVLEHTMIERPGVISTASRREDPPAGSVFVHADPGGDELRSFFRSVNPSYVEVAGGTGNALTTLLDEGCAATSELAAMTVATASVTNDDQFPDVSFGSVTMRTTDDVAELGSLLSAVEDIPLQAAVQYRTELGGLDDLKLTVARDHEGLAVGSAGVRRFDGFGLVMLVQTHPVHRRRGIAGALVAHAIRDAGIHTAFLVATESGGGVYERIGFRMVRPMHELALSR
jgi:GNAT superfamily N-acetyltransferase